MKRVVVCAAIRNAEGVIIAGARHYDTVMRSLFIRDGRKLADWLACEHGFIDQYGQWMDRKEAWTVAEAAGQILDKDVHTAGTLFSEDLY